MGLFVFVKKLVSTDLVQDYYNVNGNFLLIHIQSRILFYYISTFKSQPKIFKHWPL